MEIARTIRRRILVMKNKSNINKDKTETDCEETLFDYLEERDFITIIGNTECLVCSSADSEFYKKLDNYFCKDCFAKYVKK